MFTTYADEGAGVGATPDGRRAGEPLADSVGPVAGRSTHGPYGDDQRGVTRLPLQLATGTPVLNVRFGQALLKSSEGRKAIRDLISTYFDRGGRRIRVTAVDREVLADALVHPERHEDLIVRVGGLLGLLQQPVARAQIVDPRTYGAQRLAQGSDRGRWLLGQQLLYQGAYPLCCPLPMRKRVGVGKPPPSTRR